MAHYDEYTEYQTPLTKEQEAIVEAAKKRAVTMETDPTLEKVEGGFYNKTEGFTAHPYLQEHIGIAMERAEEQFKGWPVMPEDAETPARFPGIDPVGKYSSIDMRFAQRISQVQSAVQSRDPEVEKYVNGLLTAGRTNTKVNGIVFAMKMAANKHRTLTRASKLCLEPVGRKLLHQQSKDIKTDLAVTQYDLYLQGIEYAAGVKTGPVPKEVTDFYTQQVGMDLDMDMVSKAQQVSRAPTELSVDFQDLDHKLLQMQFAKPVNWGKKPPDAEKEVATPQEIASSIGPYARATAQRTLDPLFKSIEDGAGRELNRADLVIVDGKTVREKMFEDYLQTGRNPDHFGTYFRQNYRTAASEYVSAALMGGRRVEAFLPDKNGRIPENPVQITKTGYAPSPLKKVTLNIWERHFAKHGYFKKKVAQAAEYQRFMDARQRVKATALSGQFNMDSLFTSDKRQQFFGEWIAENGPLPTKVPHNYSADRTALYSFAVCAMAAKGHSIEDISNPDKLQAEKQAAGREVMEHLLAGDQEWAGETLFNGQRMLVNDIDRLSANLDFSKPEQLLNAANRPLFMAAYLAFDANQEESHCKAELAAAAERFAPGHGKEAAQEVASGVNTVGGLCNAARGFLGGMSAMSGGLTPTSTALNAVNMMMRFEAGRQVYGELRAKNPNTPTSKLVPLEKVGAILGFDTMIGPVQDFKDMKEKVVSDPAYRVSMAREALSGKLRERMTLLVDTEKLRGGFALDKREKADIKKDKRAERIEQADRRNAAKAEEKAKKEAEKAEKKAKPMQKHGPKPGGPGRTR